MDDCSRRHLLGITSSAALLSAAGCLSLGGDDAEGDDSEIDDPSNRIDEGTAYLTADVRDPTWLWVTDVDAVEDIDEHGQQLVGAFVPEPDDEEAHDFSTVAHLFGPDFGKEQWLLVATGEFDPAADEELEHVDNRDGYALYNDTQDDDACIAHTDGLMIAGPEDSLLAAALEAGDGEGERLLDTVDEFEHAKAHVGDADTYQIHLPDEELSDELEVDPSEISYHSTSTTVVDEQTLKMSERLECADESVATEELATRLKESEWMFGGGVSTTDADVEVDGTTVLVTFEVDLDGVAEQDEHDSPRIGGVTDITLSEEYVDVEVHEGDTTPVDELELFLNDEQYDREIWTDGAAEIAAGDVIRIGTDDLEPNTDVELRHNHSYGSEGSHTSLLSHLGFEFAYDDSGTLTVEYADDLDLDGDELYLAIFDGVDQRYPDHDSEPDTTTQPWAGNTVTSSDTASIEANYGQLVLVTWGGTDVMDDVASHDIRPPGWLDSEYDYERERLDVMLTVEEPQPAVAYELRYDSADGSLTETQFADEVETVEAETTVTLDGVESGTEVVALWGDEHVEIGRTTALPAVELDLEEDTDGYSVLYVEGPTLSADSLELVVWKDDYTRIDVADLIDGEFSPSDSLDVDATEVQHVELSYEGEPVGWASEE